MVVVDAGVAGDLSMVPLRPVVPFLRRPLRAGTGNLRRERAMEVRDVEAALALGASVAKLAIEQGASLLIPGEVGIGNTTAAAAIICTFTASEPQDVVGRGTGMDDVGLREKVQVVRDALSLHRPDPSRPHEVAAAVGGLELVAMAGYMLQGAKARVPVILDGFLSAAAALLAQALEPGVEAFFLASHVSAERGATRALAKLGLRPLFDLGLRLGEGTGAILAVDLVRSALRLPREMATFATAGIVGRAGADLPDGAP
jgi:nicotinate-nucleotide--dimethylbenzimidazole phosphoribosyltransferase